MDPCHHHDGTLLMPSSIPEIKQIWMVWRKRFGGLQPGSPLLPLPPPPFLAPSIPVQVPLGQTSLQLQACNYRPQTSSGGKRRERSPLSPLAPASSFESPAAPAAKSAPDPAVAPQRPRHPDPESAPCRNFAASHPPHRCRPLLRLDPNPGQAILPGTILRGRRAARL